MKSAVFVYGEQPLAEWIEKNSDCERMVLVGNVYNDYWNDDFSYKVKGQAGVRYFRREINIGYHSYDLLYGFDQIAKDFHPLEFDITDMHLIDGEGNIDDENIPFDAVEEQPSSIMRMLVNRKYGTRFVYNGDFITSQDGKVVIHCCKIRDTVEVPEGVETIGRLAFAAIITPQFKVVLPKEVVCIDESAFSNSEGLEGINFPDDIKTLGEDAFQATGLTEVLLPDGIEEIPAGCFSFTYIEKIHFPKNLKYIRNCAFLGLECNEIRLPRAVEVVESWSIDGNYRKIWIPKSIKEIAYDFYYEEGIDPCPWKHKPIIVKY